MDMKDDKKSFKFRDHPHTSSRYFESNAGHLFVNNVNPYNTVENHACDVKENLINKLKNDEFIDMFDNAPTREPNTTPSKQLVNEIMNNCPFSRDMYMDDPYDEIHEAFLDDKQYFMQPTASMNANLFDTQSITSYSKGTPKPPRCKHQARFENVYECNEENNSHRAFPTNEIMTDALAEGNERADKNTYCRPLFNMYNQEFVYKTMQRNARLQKIVRKLVIAREREKQREAWNNYINDLKTKHRYYSNEPSRIAPQYVPEEQANPEMIDDFYNTRFSWRQSNPCQHLLQDFYGAHNSTSPHAYKRYSTDDTSSLTDDGSNIYDNDRLCYPTSSQAYILRWNRERQNNQFPYDWRTRPAGRFFHGNTIVTEKERKNLFDKVQGTTRSRLSCGHTTKSSICKNKMCSVIWGSSIPNQTENKKECCKALPLVNEEDDRVMNVQLSQKHVQVDKDIYFSDIQNKEKIDSNRMIPQYQVSLKPNMNENVSKQATSKQAKNVNVSPKYSYLNEIEQETPKNKMDVRFFHTQESLEYEKDEDILDKKESLKDKVKRVTKNVATLKNKIKNKSEEEDKIKSLASIEDKIDSLMKSVNSLMADLKTKNSVYQNRRSAAVSCTCATTSRTNLSRHRSDPYGLIKEDIVCGMVHSSSRNLTISEIGPSKLIRHKESSISKIDTILLEEMNKSNKVKRDIEELLHLHSERNNCSIQITFDIPTKEERSTEVTDSLCKAQFDDGNSVVFEEIPVERSSGRHRQMTIAVNTDPLGLLALLRVSTEAVKQLLSFVPNLNYNSYLSMLQLPLPSRRGISHYICKICGAAFSRPSQLSDHIEQHNFGRTRDCCVCRHNLDVRRTCACLFACRYCGQQFTRAYCCELHQQTCAKQLGRHHDVNSSHMLLQ